MTLGLGILSLHEDPVYLPELRVLSLEMFAIWLSLPVLSRSTRAHPGTLGSASRRKNPCLRLSLSFPRSLGTHAPCLFSRVHLRVWRQSR